MNSTRSKKRVIKQVRTCPLCGGKCGDSFTRHCRDYHESDVGALIYHLWRALHRGLNRRKR
jgi:hypothetical protein